MNRFIFSSIVSLALVSACGFAAIADPGSDPATIGKVQSMTVSPKVMAELKSATQHYLDAALNDQDAFFASVSPDYRAVSKAGKSFSAGQVYGIAQGLKLELSGIISNVRVIDAHHLGNVYDETAVLAGSADTIDSQGARTVAASWLHKITFVRASSGALTVSRDQVIARFS
jgi:hypothetical protein